MLMFCFKFKLRKAFPLTFFFSFLKICFSYVFLCAFPQCVYVRDLPSYMLGNVSKALWKKSVYDSLCLASLMKINRRLCQSEYINMWQESSDWLFFFHPFAGGLLARAHGCYCNWTLVPYMTVWSLEPHSQSASLKNHYYVLPISNILVKRKGNLSVKEWVVFKRVTFLLYTTCSCPHIWEGPFSKLFLSVVSALTVSECWKSFFGGSGWGGFALHSSWCQC